MSVAELRNEQRGKDIWVIAAGKSMDFIDPHFFFGRVTIAVNEVDRKFPATYLVRNDDPIHQLADQRTKLVIPHRNWAKHDTPPLEYAGPCWRYDHLDNRAVIDHESLRHVGSPNSLAVGKTTLLPAMHLAAHLGAANVILCGADGGALEGQTTYSGYYPDQLAWYGDFVREIMGQIRLLRDRLQSVYGCRIYSLSPFVGLTTDHHRFELLG